MVDLRARSVAGSFRRVGSTLRDTKDTVASRLSFHRTDTVHIAKTTLAAVLAWAGARWLTMADAAVWMGPATAVVVVQTTVYRSLANGVRKVGAVTMGVLISGLVGRILGLNAVSLFLIVPLALLAGRWRRVGDRGADIVTTAVLMLSYGASAAHHQYLRDYVIQTVMGALAGVVVNLAIPPPLQVRRSHSLMRGVIQDTATLLRRIADGLHEDYEASDLRDWQREVDDLDTELGHAAEALQDGAESRRFNPRRMLSPLPPPHTYRPMLRAMRLIMPSVNSIIRALDHKAELEEYTPEAPPQISDSFAHTYGDLLKATADAIAEQGENPADSDEDAREYVTASLDKASTIHDRMTVLVRDGGLSKPGAWAVSGSLLIDAERILSALTWCADTLEETRGSARSGTGR